MSGKVSFKMPFDELRGKLATKQKNIVYSGQEQGQNIATLEGKKSATNFDKYIVAYKRNGQNRYYIKSNTSIHNTTIASRQRGAFATAQYLWDYAMQASVAGDAFRTSMRVYAERYSVAMGKTYTDREYFVAVITEGIAANQAQIAFPSYLENGEVELVGGFNNPFYNLNGLHNENWIFNKTLDTYVLQGVGKPKSLAQVLRDYAPIMAPYSQFEKTIQIEGVQRQARIVFSSATTAQQFVSSPYGVAVRATLGGTDNNHLGLYLFDAKTGKRIGTAIYYLYTDLALTTPVTTTMNLDQGVYYASPNSSGR